MLPVDAVSCVILRVVSTDIQINSLSSPEFEETVPCSPDVSCLHIDENSSLE